MAGARRSKGTRQTIIEAAFREMYVRGFQAASLDTILARTGVTKGALYHHFPSKLHLGYAVVDEVLETVLRQVWLLPAEGCDDPVGTLVSTVRAAVATVDDTDLGLGCPIANLALEMSPVDEGFRERLDRLYQEWSKSFAALLRRGQELGQVRSDIDAEGVAAFLVASIAGGRTLAKTSRSHKVLNQCFDQLCELIESLRAARD